MLPGMQIEIVFSAVSIGTSADWMLYIARVDNLFALTNSIANTITVESLLPQLLVGDTFFKVGATLQRRERGNCKGNASRRKKPKLQNCATHPSHRSHRGGCRHAKAAMRIIKDKLLN